MSVGAFEVALVTAQLAARWMDYSQRAEAGEMTQAEMDEVWDEIAALSAHQQKKIDDRIAQKKAEAKS